MIDERLEGFARFTLTITKEGTASDITTVAVVGPKDMVRSALLTLSRWTWKPGTLDGVPVPVNRAVEAKFRMPAESPGARPQTIRSYQQARHAIDESNWQEAKTILDEAQAKRELTLYERGMLANAAAQVALKQNDYFEARRLSIFATAHSYDVLPAQVMISLWQTQIMSSLALGDIVNALNAFDKLKTTRGFDPSSPIVKYLNDTKAKADAMPVFGMSAKIPRADEAESIVLGLYRRTFTFKDVAGTLDKFTLSCKQRAIESKITDNAEWRVPKGWSECDIKVQGTPGTTFKVVQAE
jgi:hypothetical protein